MSVVFGSILQLNVWQLCSELAGASEDWDTDVKSELVKKVCANSYNNSLTVQQFKLLAENESLHCFKSWLLNIA